MNLTYDTRLPFQPPAQSRQPALTSLAAPPKHKGYGSNYGDLNREYALQNMSNYTRAADQANFGYDVQRAGAQQALALSGLNMMAQEQQRQRDLASARLQNMRSALGALL